MAGYPGGVPDDPHAAALEVERLLAGVPSATAWAALTRALSACDERTVARSLAGARRWPAELRVIGAHVGRPEGRVRWDDVLSHEWSCSLFAGRVDVRLAACASACVAHAADDVATGLEPSGLLRVARAFARHLDPTFDPPDVEIASHREYTSAAGCGGGFAYARRGDATRGFDWDEVITEHAADDSYDGAWTPYGHRSATRFSVGRWEREGGRRTFAAIGPTPEVLELAHAFGLLVADPARLEDLGAALAESRATVRPLFGGP